MARPRYSANKRQREMKKKAERERKLARKHTRKTAPDLQATQVTGPDTAHIPDEILPPDTDAPQRTGAD
jgi:hypothetical protein